MANLLEFLEFFAGPRKPTYGESASALSKTDLPAPLHELYAFAADWPSGSGRLLASQNTLVPLSELQTIDGRTKFVEENQWCWCLGTEPKGTNPEVYYAHETDSPDWSPTGIKLIECLQTFVLTELIFGAELRTSDTVLPKETFLLEFCKQRWKVRQLCKATRLHDADHRWDFYLADNSVLIQRETYVDAEFVSCSANSEHGQEELEALIEELGLDAY